MGLWLKTTNGEIVEINTDGLAEAPEDGKQYARKDAAWAEVAATDIDDAPEDGKQYARQDAAWSEVEAAEVLRGDPNNPPADWATDQLLYDGIEDDGSGGGGGGGDGGPHDHDDYLPLEGGTLTGKLETPVTFDTGAPTYTFTGATGAGMWCYDSNLMGFAVGGSEFFRVENDVSTFKNDLQVDSNATVGNVLTVDNTFNTAWANVTNNLTVGALLTVAGNLQVDGYLVSTSDLYANINGAQYRFTDRYLTSYSNTGGARLRADAAGDEGTPTYAFYGDPDTGMYRNSTDNLAFAAGGQRIFRIDKNQGAKVFGDLQVDGTINGQTVFGIATDIDTADVLDRAETATMPVVDDEGVATTDAETVTVNEVMTALLAKVKQLSAEIEELKKGA